MQNAFANLSIPHFFRYLLLNLALFFSFCALYVPGFIWTANILDKTGYRKIDLLWGFIPVVGSIVFTRTQWRYCAKSCYWETPPPVVPVPVPVAA